MVCFMTRRFKREQSVDHCFEFWVHQAQVRLKHLIEKSFEFAIFETDLTVYNQADAVSVCHLNNLVYIDGRNFPGFRNRRFEEYDA